jgi:hypothetical protein
VGRTVQGAELDTVFAEYLTRYEAAWAAFAAFLRTRAHGSCQ